MRTVRKAFAKQVLAIGDEPVWFVGALAVLVGISVVVQLAFWVGEAGQSQLLGPRLVPVLAGEPGNGNKAGQGVPFTGGFGEVSTVGLYPIARGQPMA